MQQQGVNKVPSIEEVKVGLVVLDGWGHRHEKRYNAIAQAHTPHWDKLVDTYGMSLLSACGESVGLPRCQMGNSEVGHMHIGSGQIIEQDLLRINQACDSGTMGSVLKTHLSNVKPRRIHVMGLYSDGGVHAHQNHWHALLNELKDTPVVIHPFLDGRDTPPKVALSAINDLEMHCAKNGCHRIGSIAGRFYAMDRDNRWERTNQYLNLFSELSQVTEQSPSQSIERSYASGVTDEFVKPVKYMDLEIQEGDLFIMMNFRPDRMRQITDKLKDKAQIVCMTDYGLELPVLFKKKTAESCLGSVFEAQGLSQIRIAETEKFPHVTYFLNGGKEVQYKGETRRLIPSPKVKTYDELPEMSSQQVYHAIEEAMAQGINGIFANFANADMVGHTGNFAATVKAIESLDRCIGRLVTSAQKFGYQLLICADHGNAEWMWRPETNERVTSHTCSSVPLVATTTRGLMPRGILSDVAPTLLAVAGIESPNEWNGRNLLLPLENMSCNA